GGFLVAFGVLLCYAVGEVVPLRAAWSPERVGASGSRSLLRPLVAAGVVAAACTLLNPWGWRLPVHLISFFTIHGPALRATTEFAPAAADDRAGLALFVFTGLCIAGVACGLRAGGLRSRAPGRGAVRPGGIPAGPFYPATLLALALTTAMAFASIRHVEVMAVFGALVISGGSSSLLRARSDGPTLDK